MKYHTIYANDEFEEEYFEHLIPIALEANDLNLSLKFKNKNSSKKKIPQMEAQIVRALIKKYIDYHRAKDIKKTDAVGKDMCSTCKHNNNREQCLKWQSECTSRGAIINPKWKQDEDLKNEK